MKSEKLFNKQKSSKSVRAKDALERIMEITLHYGFKAKSALVQNAISQKYIFLKKVYCLHMSSTLSNALKEIV